MSVLSLTPRALQFAGEFDKRPPRSSLGKLYSYMNILEH